MKLVFFGSDDFAAINLNRLLNSQHRVVGCVTQPDKPQGRGMAVVASPIKDIALAHHLPCVQPATLKDAAVIDQLKSFGADVFVVVAYGKLLSATILSIPKVFCINVHGSLLPKYRGAAPINWAILNGDATTGVTIMKMDVAMDAGDIISKDVIAISPDTTAIELRATLAHRGAELLAQTLDAIEHGKYKLTPQDHRQATVAPKLTKDMGRIIWSQSAQTITRQIRGLQTWPGTFTIFQNKMIKVLKASAAPISSPKTPGEVIAVDKAGIHVACGEGTLIVQEVHPEAGKPMPAAAFAAGYRIVAGIKL